MAKMTGSNSASITNMKGKLAPLLHFLLLVVTTVTSFYVDVSSAVNATISRDKIVEVGSNVTLDCTLRGNEEHSSDIIWFSHPPELQQQVPSSLYYLRGNRTSRLHLVNVTTNDTGIYYCALPSDGKDAFAYQASRIIVGGSPTPPFNIHCMSRNMLDFWCVWEHETPANIHTQYIFQYKGMYETNPVWRTCPDYHSKGPKSCFVPYLLNSGLDQLINVTATNVLGSRFATFRFDPNSAVIPNPPNNIKWEPVGKNAIKVSWDLPSDWEFMYSSRLGYRLRFLGGHVEEELSWVEIPSKKLRGYYIRRPMHIIRNLQPGNIYHIEVACMSKYGRPRGRCWSEWSERVTMQLPPAAPSGTVDNFDATEYRQITEVGDVQRDILLTWQPVPERYQNGDITNYSLFIQSDGGDEEVVVLPALSNMYQLQDCEIDQTYTISISAANAAGNGPNATILVEMQDSVLRRPSNLRVSYLANRSLLISWTPPHLLPQWVDSYELQWRQDSMLDLWESLDVPGPSQQFIVRHPHNPASYSFRIRSKTRGQQSLWSPLLNFSLNGLRLDLRHTFTSSI